MKCMVCYPGPETAEAARDLASALDSRAVDLQSSAVDLSALVASSAVQSLSFADVEVAVVYAPPEFCDDVWRLYGLLTFAHSLLPVLGSVCFYGRSESKLIGSSPLPVFASNDEDGLQSLVAFIEAAGRRGSPTTSVLGNGVAGPVSRRWSVQPAHSTEDETAKRHELISLLTSPGGEAISEFIVRMLNLVSTKWGPFAGDSILRGDILTDANFLLSPPRSKQESGNVRRPLRVFFSYSHSDERMRDELSHHLAGLRRSRLIESWHDRCLRPGAKFNTEIARQLELADLILLLVSARFLASDYCYSKEMLRAIQRHREGAAHVVPIILRPVDWHETPLGELLALPKDGRAVITWPRRDAAWATIAREIRRLVEGFGATETSL